MRAFLIASSVAACLGSASIALANPLANPLAAAQHETVIRTGVVAERLPAGKYTYLRLAGAEPFWIATLGPGAAPGAAVEIKSFACSQDFHSRRLDRRFATLHFGVVEAR